MAPRRDLQRPLVEIAEKYLRKGSKIYVEGQLQTRKWTDQQGQERYTTEVVLSRFRGELTMLDGAGGGGRRGGTGGVDGTRLRRRLRPRRLAALRRHRPVRRLAA